MSLGLALFLSTLFIVFVYAIENNLINWKQFIKFIIFFILSVFVISCISFVIYYLLYIKEYKTYPQTVNEYWNVKIGDSLEDVLFYKGEPQHYYRKYEQGKDKFAGLRIKPESIDEFEKFGGYELPDTKNKSKWEKYRIKPIVILYENKDSSYQIEFTQDEKVEFIACYGKYSWSCPAVSTISIGSSFERVIKTFGYPKEENYNKSLGFRYLYYPEYNIKFHLKKNEVIKIIHLHNDKKFNPYEHGARLLNNP